MRIVCPNCAAEYEVDVAVIPDEGRDVQCSSCGHAWFVGHPDSGAMDASEELLFEPPPEPQPQPNDMPTAQATRPMDEAVLSVLREEAERETRQRQAEARPVIESQPDLGLSAPAAPEPAVSEPTAEDSAPAAGPAAGLSAVAERVARLKGQTATAAPSPSPSSAARNGDTGRLAKRSDLLPEIDEIKSSLRPAAEKRPGAAAAVAKSMPGKGGFGRGFLFGLMIWAIVIAAYVMAPKLAQQFPAMAPALNAFVGAIDGMRAAIARMGGQLIDMLSRLAG